MEPSHDEHFSISNPLGELVVSPTPYTSIFWSIHPNEVWVRSLFFMVPHECEIPISSFDDDITREPSYLHFQHYHLLHYDDTHIHGCTYDFHLIHLNTHDFPLSLLSPFYVGVTSSNTWVKRCNISKILSIFFC